MSQVVLIDGKNFCHRHHWTHQGLSSHGRPTSVLFGACAGLLSLARKLPDVPFVFVWDGEGDTWRHKVGARVYKANRALATNRKPRDRKSLDDLNVQIPLFKKFIHRIGLRNFEVDNLEGDDLIGILMSEILRRKLFDSVTIHSTDRDFYQFIGKRVHVLKRQDKGKLLFAQREDIKKEFGVAVEDYPKLRALIGDSGDNILQMYPGLGPATGAKLVLQGLDASIESFHDLKTRRLFRHGIKVRGKECNVKKDWDLIHTNFRLCQIVTDPEDACLTKKVRRDLRRICNRMSAESFMRDQSKLTDGTWSYMTRFLAGYEMHDLFTLRPALWSLP